MKTKAILEVLESRIAPAFAGVLDLGSFATAHVDGHTANDQAGFSVADAGDFNGDNINDFIVGAPGAANGAGAAYVVYGKEGGLPATTDLDSLSASTGFKIEGSIGGANLGRAVAGAGDINGDGFDDVVVGAPLANINGNQFSGISYVIFGGDTQSGGIATNQINGDNGFGIFGNGNGDLSGISVCGAGDVNGDGFADVVVGASGYDAPQQGGGTLDDAGGAVVIYGHAGAFNAFTAFSQVGNGNVNAGFRITGEATGDGAGISVSGAGDFNGDGIGDLLIGATGAGTGGAAYVVYGSKTMSNSSLPGDLKITGVASGDSFGDAVASAGDINGDGFSDIIIGATGNDSNGNNSGECDIIFGGKNIGGTMSALNADIRLQGSGDNLLAGTSVHTAGDFNGDGFDDLVIGATHANVAPGEAYVVFGRPDGFQSPVNLSALDGTNGIKIVGDVTGDDGGFSVSLAGDINHDGFDDLLFAAPGRTVSGKTDAGKTTFIYGSNGGNQVAISADGRSATYTDADGDLVTVKVNKGTLEQNDFKLSGQNYLGGSTLQLLDLKGHADMDKVNVTVTAKPQLINGVLSGDGHANIGELDATGMSLGAVKINGDLGQINAGAGGFQTPGVKSLSVYSLGKAREITQNPTELDDLSFIAGSLGSLKVATNVDGVRVLVGKIGTAKVAGDVNDSTFFISGDSAATSNAEALALKSFKVGGDFDHSEIRGGVFLSGNPDVQLGRIAIGGDLIASNIIAGITAGKDTLYATDDDALFSGGSPAIASRIASVVVKGQAIGSVEAGGRFAIEAEQIGSVKVGATKIALNKAGKDQFVPVGGTSDFFAHEL